MEVFAVGKADRAKEISVREIMKTDVIRVKPETLTLEALRLMRDKKIGCLPVVDGDRLVGLITAYDFLTVSAKLLEERLIDLPQNSDAEVESQSQS